MDLLPTSWTFATQLETAILELVVRGTLLYFGVLVLMRLMPRRTGGELATMDLVFLLLIAEAVAHSLGDYTAVPDGLILVATFMGWNYLLNSLSYYVPVIERLVSAPPLQIVKSGRMMRRNMRREYITEEELMSYLRQEGIEKLEDVKAAYVESEGQITVVSR